jgi:hypothetical protein
MLKVTEPLYRERIRLSEPLAFSWTLVFQVPWARPVLKTS